MIINVVVRDVEGNCESPVSLEPGAFVIALQRILSTRRVGHTSSNVAPNLLLLALTIASDDDLERTGLLLLAC